MMSTSTPLLSKTRINRLHEQGYQNVSDSQLTSMAFGIRFAYRVCTILLIIGLAFPESGILYFDLTVAFFGIFLANHPFDYIYNYLLADWMGKPKLPKRSVNLKFACGIATPWIASVIYLFNSGAMAAAYVMGLLFLSIAAILSLTDFCIPSVLFNELISIKHSIVNFSRKIIR